jgi:hypothetical protein
MLYSLPGEPVLASTHGQPRTPEKFVCLGSKKCRSCFTANAALSSRVALGRQRQTREREGEARYAGAATGALRSMLAVSLSLSVDAQSYF